MKYQFASLLLLLFLLSGSVVSAEERVPFPTGYHDSFVEYLSIDRIMNPDQIMRIYANEAAQQGRDQQGHLPNGSVLVGEVYSVRKDDTGEVIVSSLGLSSLGRRIEDKLVLIAVMERREGFAESSTSSVATGDWDFGAYTPDGKVAAKELDECRICHAPLKDYEFMFSLDHLPINAINASSAP